MNNEREDVVEESEEKGGEKRNENHNHSESDRLFACWPRDVRELALGIFDVVPESFHIEFY